MAKRVVPSRPVRAAGALTPAKSGGLWGYADEHGRMVIAGAWDDALPFERGVGRVRRGRQWFYIDKRGEVFAAATPPSAPPESGPAMQHTGRRAETPRSQKGRRRGRRGHVVARGSAEKGYQAVPVQRLSEEARRRRVAARDAVLKSLVRLPASAGTVVSTPSARPKGPPPRRRAVVPWHKKGVHGHQGSLGSGRPRDARHDPSMKYGKDQSTPAHFDKPKKRSEWPFVRG